MRTSIGLALIAKLRGYPITIVMPDNNTAERRQLLELYGADIVFTPGVEGSNGAVRRAQQRRWAMVIAGILLLLSLLRTESFLQRTAPAVLQSAHVGCAGVQDQQDLFVSVFHALEKELGAATHLLKLMEARKIIGQVYVDEKAVPLIKGSTVDYVDAMMGAGFTVDNPNSVGGCGCRSVHASSACASSSALAKRCVRSRARARATMASSSSSTTTVSCPAGISFGACTRRQRHCAASAPSTNCVRSRPASRTSDRRSRPSPPRSRRSRSSSSAATA